MITFIEFLNRNNLLEALNRRIFQKGDEWNSPVNWGVIVDWLHHTVCDERRKYGDCHHPRCDRANELEEMARDFDVGESRASKQDLDRIVNFIYSNTCTSNRSKGRCSHQSCGYNMHLIDWLYQQQAVA